MINILVSWFTLCLLMACNDAEPSTPGPKPINVATYNIHHANPPSREKGFIDLDAIAQTIRKTGAHLVALQELDSVTGRSGKTFQLKELADKLGMHYYFAKAIPYDGGAYGVGILSKYPIQEARTIQLPNTEGFKGEDRVLALAKVILPGNKQIYFGSTHLDVTLTGNRLLQTRAITALASTLDAPVIVGGDFNATDDQEAMREFLINFKDASTAKAPTIPATRPTRRIDYIVFTKPGDFEVLKETVVTEDNYGSDHLAYWVRLKY